jgi:hypothetical protein
MAMSSRPSSIGTSRTKASVMPTSSPAHRSSMARSSGRTGLMSRNSTSC